MKKIRIIALICTLMMVLGIFAGCGSSSKVPAEKTALTTEGQEAASTQEKNPYEKKIEFTASCHDITEGTDYTSDAVFKTISDKFNFSYKLIPVSWENWNDKNRIWLNSGDMPDITFWNFNYKEYESYAKSGMIKALPDNYETKYPNLGKSITRTGIADFLKNKMDGKLYFVPKVIYLTPITEKVIDPITILYRKDWAEKVGRQIGKMVTIDELTSLARDFVDKDPGGNGAGKTIGISSRADLLSCVFVKPFNSYFDQYHKLDGKYVWGPTESSTLEGVKVLAKYYNEGVIDKDFYTFKGIEYRDKFFAGKAGIFIDGCAAGNLMGYKEAFAKSNPGIDADKAIGLCQVLGPDEKYHGSVSVNFWASSIFSPKMDDEKLDRILSIMDYVATPEGQKLINLGIEGKDYKQDGDTITITREKDEKGAFKPITKIYPSANFFYLLVVLPDDWSANDPSIPANDRNQVKELFQEKEKVGNLAEIDYDAMLFTAPNYDKAKINIADGLTEVILKKGDVSANWNNWLKSVEPKVNPALKELNDAFAK